MNSLRIIGLLLDYPSEDLWEHKMELLEAVTQSAELNAEQRLDLALYITDFCKGICWMRSRRIPVCSIAAAPHRYCCLSTCMVNP